MLNTYLITSLLLCVAISLAPCEPFGLRLYYGDIVINPYSSEKLAIYFNTKQPCPSSFINIISRGGFKKQICKTKSIATSSFTNFYTAYIHVCSYSEIPLEESFSYTAYGWDMTLTSNPTPFKEQWIDVKLIDPRPKDRALKMVVLSDWGTIDANINIMTPITKDLQKVMREKQINAIMIAGDIAYDLDSNNGTTYEQFLQLMEEVSTNTPFFIAPGNHERNTPDANLLFTQSFKVYEVSEKLATGISFGSIFLAMFDPYGIIYSKQEATSSLDALRTELQKGVKSGRFIVAYSHYPLTCSGQYGECNDGLNRLREYFNAMIDSGVSLYIGAHTHSYQRNYPYFRNGSFVPLESPYDSQGKYLISVVEGVAGNDRSILTVMPDKKEFTARYTVNQTGFAVFGSNTQYVSYSHFSTKQGFMDEIKINKAAPSLPHVQYNLKIQDD